MNQSSKPSKKEKTLDDWLVIFGLLGVGVLLIGWGILGGWNFVLIVLGLVLSGSSILGTPEVRVYLGLSSNRVSGNQVTQRDVSESTVIGGDVHGDVIINKGAKPLSTESVSKKEPAQPSRPPPGNITLVDEAVVVQPKDTKEYKIELKKGQTVTIEAGADYPITVDLVSQTELLKSEKRSLKTIATERQKTDVKNATLEYEAKRNGTWYVHIHNEQRKLPLEVGVIISVE